MNSTKVKRWLPLIVVIASIALGFALTYKGIHMGDDHFRYDHSRWLIARITGNEFVLEHDSWNEAIKAYGPLWEIILGICTEYIFAFLRDPHWVRHAFTFSMLPIGLYALYVCLRRIGYAKPTALLCTAIMLSIIRLGGHSVFNMKDATGAVAYTLASIILWLLLSNEYKQHSVLRLFGIGALSVIPFLIRTPLLLHAIITIGLLVSIAVVQTSWSLRRRVATAIVPILGASITLALVYPPVQEVGLLQGLASSVQTFSNFGERGLVRLFGQTYLSTNPPWWYMFAWIPVIIHPVGLLTSFIGYILLFSARTNPVSSFTLRIKKIHIALSFRQWLFGLLLLTWFFALLTASTLYNEERQLLFLYPLLYILGGLGYQHVAPRIQYTIACLLIAVSAWSYASWGEYSYIYKSPIIGNIEAKNFTGDYFAICLSNAIRALPSVAPGGSTVRVDSFYRETVDIQYKRLRNGLLTGVPNYPEYTFVSKKASTPYYRMSFYHNAHKKTDFSEMEKDLASGEAKRVWSSAMPTGEEACMIILYE